MPVSNHTRSDVHVARFGLSWGVALFGAILATGVGSVFVVGGLIDWSERNITARTLWGVLAMATSLVSPVYLVWLLVRRTKFAVLSPERRWAVAIAVPIVLICVPIGLAILGYFIRSPIVIP